VGSLEFLQIAQRQSASAPTAQVLYLCQKRAMYVKRELYAKNKKRQIIFLQSAQRESASAPAAQVRYICQKRFMYVKRELYAKIKRDI